MQLREARIEASKVAEQIVSGTIDPYDGAMMIWKQILDNLNEKIPDDLWTFKSCASAIEDYLFNTKDSGANYDAQIAKEKVEIMQAAIALHARR